MSDLLNRSIQKVPSPPGEERASAYLMPMVGVRGGMNSPINGLYNLRRTAEIL
jgi:hypothetical protein